MDFFADNIEISIVNVETARPIPNIAIYVRLFAKHKNDYFMTYISNESELGGRKSIRTTLEIKTQK
jgi:hypothetical protein